MERNRIADWSNWSNIGTFIFTVVILVIMLLPSRSPTDPVSQPISRWDRAVMNVWLMPSILAAAVLGAGILNFLAHRRMREVESKIPSILINGVPVAGRAKFDAGKAVRERAPETKTIDRIEALADDGDDTAGLRIAKLSDQVSYNITNGLTFPLKLHMQFRNDSAVAIDVQLKEFRSELIAVKGFPQDVLQLRLGGAWLPQLHGVSRIAAHPTQQFQAWLAIDEGRFNKGQVEEHRGKIGTLVLLVNGQDVEFKL